MGLDMYLYASEYESASKWEAKENAKEKERYDNFHYSEALKDLEAFHRERNFIARRTEYQIGYWRKFNALHKYIVDNFADGVDECQEIYLSQGKIEQILSTLKSLTPDNALEKMPPSEGFFFGSQEIDNWYWEDVKYSIELFEMVLEYLHQKNDIERGCADIIYHASW